MIKATTQPSAAESQYANIAKWYEEQCAVPSDMQSTLPWGLNNAIVNFVADNLFALFYKGVEMQHTTVNGKDYYRISVSCLIRKHHIVLTPFAAYMYAKAIGSLMKMGMRDDFLIESESAGATFIPRWAWKNVYNACAEIVETHKEDVKNQAAFMCALLDEKEDVATPPTIKH